MNALIFKPETDTQGVLDTEVLAVCDAVSAFLTNLLSKSSFI